MTVYIDEVFLVNLIMDWLILWATGNLAQSRCRLWSLAAAAIAGAVYSVSVFSPWGGWFMQLPVKISCSFFMVWLAFGFCSWQHYVKHIVYFYLISFVLGGASLAAMYLFGQRFMQTWNGIALVQIDFQLFWLAIAVFLVGGSVFFLRQHLRKDLTALPSVLTAQICLGEHQIILQLLVDTGCSLTEPLSGLPVIVAEQNAVMPLFPEKLQQMARKPETGADQLLLAAEACGMQGRWRFIPYRAVGQQGLLPGFRPDVVVLQYGATQKTYHDVIIAVSNQKFSPYETYQGLVQPELL